MISIHSLRGNKEDRGRDGERDEEKNGERVGESGRDKKKQIQCTSELDRDLERGPGRETKV